MTPEQAALRDLLARAAQVARGLDEAKALMGPLPASPETFESLDLVQRTAATALLKRVEQLQDVLGRLFRTSLTILGLDTRDLYARDIANRMERERVVASADRWMEIVRLRNRLVHEYPLAASERLARLGEAVAACDDLKAALSNAGAFVSKRRLLE